MRAVHEAQTYAVCETCKRLNRVQLTSVKTPVCGACKSELQIQGAIVEATDSTLQTLVSKSPLVVVVDVWAPWCGPCRAFAPTFEEVGNRFSGKAVFAKLNSEQNQQAAGALGVRGIPTILVFKSGTEVSRQSGAMPKEMFEQWVDQFTK